MEERRYCESDADYRLDRDPNARSMATLLADAPSQAILAPEDMDPHSTAITKDGDDFQPITEDFHSHSPEPDIDGQSERLPGFARYHHRYNAQIELSQKRVVLRYLHLAFAKLRKLQHVIYTDYRALLRLNENVPSLCFRLFGNSVAPEALSNGASGEPNMNLGSDNAGNAQSLLRNLMQLQPQQLETLHFGRSDATTIQWGHLVGSEVSMLPLIESRSNLSRRSRQTSEEMNAEIDGRMRDFTCHLRSLRLPVKAVEFQELDASGQQRGVALRITKNLLVHTTSTLRHLELVAVRDPNENANYLDLGYLQRPVFPHALASLVFKWLKPVVLCGWVLTWEDLEVFL